MSVDTLVFVLLIHMALLAGNLFLRVNRVIVCNHATEYLMIFCPVTVGALHIEFAAHVHIEILGGEVETLV